MRTRYDMLADGFEQAGIPAQRFTKWVREGRREIKIENFTIRAGNGDDIDVSSLWAYGKWVGWTVIRTDTEGFIDRIILNKGKRVVEVVSAVAAELERKMTA